MKKTIAVLIILLITVYAFTQAPDWEWANQAGRGGDERGFDIAIDSEQNTYITGKLSGSAIFGSDTLWANNNDLFVAKMNAFGYWEWAISAGGNNGSDYGYGITVDNIGNIFVTGSFFDTAYFGSITLVANNHEQDIFVAKVDNDGNWLWAVKAGGGGQGEKGKEIKVDNEGNCYVTGIYQGTADFGTHTISYYGYTDIFTAKIDANGNWLWATGAGGNGYDCGNSIAIDEAGNSYVTGFFRETATFGSYSLTTSGYDEIFVAKMDVNGNWLWASKAGGSNSDMGEAITIDDACNSYVTGYFEETAFFGYDSLTSSGGMDIFVTKIDTEGNWLWASKAGGSNSDMGEAITIDAAGNSYLTGWFRETAEFGSNSITSSGYDDIFVAKLERDFIANFTAEPVTCYLTREIDFIDISSGNVLTWQWDFQNDDNYDSFVQNPTFTYTDVGVYDLKLKISNETQVDSLIKYDYITVEYIPPAAPDSVQVNIVHPDAVISWSAVDKTIFGDPITPDGYIILFSENEEDYFYLWVTMDTTFTHIRVAEFRDQMFYQVVAFINYSREQIEYLIGLNNSQEKVKWLDVKRTLEAIK